MTRAAFLVKTARPATIRALNYTPEVEHIARPKNADCRSQRLITLLSSIGKSYFSVFTRLDSSRQHGIELLSQTDMFAAEPDGRIIRRDSMPRPENHEVRRWQILIAGAGQMAEGNLFGRSIIADARLVGRYLGPHAVALEFPEPGGDQNLWTYAFLNTSLGLKAIRACAFGTSVPGLRLDLLGELPIPEADSVVRRRVADLVRRCVQKREAYREELNSAEEALYAAIPALRDSSGLYGRAAWIASSVVGATTLSARNHRPGIGRVRGVPLASLLRHGRPEKPARFARTQCNPKFGVPFLSQRDIFSIRPIPQFIVPPGHFADLRAKSGTLIVAAAGQSGAGTLFGRVELGDLFAQALISEHTLRLTPLDEQVPPGFLLCVLRSAWGLGALKACSTGTSVPSLDPDLLSQLHVPRASPEAEALIAMHVRRAYHARIEACSLEVDAVNAVEEILSSWLA